MEAGRKTVAKILAEWTDLDDEEDDEDSLNQLRTLTGQERAVLQRLLRALEANQERDPKYHIVREQLLDRGWRELGCIIFSQYFDSVFWLAEQLTEEMPEEEIGVYAGSQRSGVMHKGVFTRTQRDVLKERVRRGEIRILIGTDAASEGLNLQRLGTLINLDLPWNPSRLENIATLFGQIPGILEDVWIDVALGEVARAKTTIDAVPRKHPFELRYHTVAKVDWESCAQVLDSEERKRCLSQGWS